MPPNTKKRILMINVWATQEGPATNSYLYKPLGDLGYVLEVKGIPGGTKARLLYGCLTTDIPFDAYDGIVCPEYGRAVGMAIRKRLTGHKTPIVAVGLNQAGALFKTGIRPLDSYVDKALGGIALSIVHSQHERDLWTEIHNIPAERMPFAHWGYDVPDIKTNRFSSYAEPYFCMIGRNNRDYDTFCTAVEKAGTKGIIITDEVCAKEVKATDNVEVHLNLPLEDCMDCIRGSLANVILVNDDNRGAGHITAVSGMHLGKPTIYTDCQGIADYLIDRYNGLGVPLRDAEATAAAMAEMVADPELSTKLGEAGKAYASRWLTTEAAGRAHAAIIVAGIEEKTVPPASFEWLLEYESLVAV